MRITETGNIGIGTSNPTARLHVKADVGSSPSLILHNQSTSDGRATIYLQNDRTTTQSYEFGLDPGGSNAKKFQVRNVTTNTWPFTITNTDNVGIGTVTPSYKLDIDANTGSTGNPLRLQGLQAGATTDSLLSSQSGVVKRLAISELGTGNFWKIGGNTEGVLKNFGTTDNFALPFLTNNVERMRITNTGNIGIGTSNPQGKLHLRGSIILGDTITCASYAGLPFSYPSATSSALWFGTHDNVGTNDYGLMYGEVNGGSDNYTFNILAGDNLGDKIFVGNVDFSTSAKKGITITSGNLGVNTAAPVYKLDIDANTGSTGNPLRLQGLQAGATSDSILTSASGVVRRMSFSSLLANGLTASNGLTIASNDVKLGGTLSQNTTIAMGTNNVLFTGTGNVAVGTASPTSTLHIAGSVSTAFRRVTANVTVGNTDHIVLVNCASGTVTMTLPAASTCAGREYIIGKTDETANALSFSAALKLTESTTVSSISFAKKYKIVSDGTDWWIVNE